MSSQILLRGFVALLLSGAICYAVYSNSLREADPELAGNRQRYRPILPNYLLPAFLGVLVVLSCFSVGFRPSMELILSLCAGIFFDISVYYLILLLILPLLRRCLSARTCAALWLIPNYLYLTQQNYIALPEPRWVLRVPVHGVEIIAVIWGIGFAGVLLWKGISHSNFRHKILSNACSVTDPAILALWEEEQRKAGFKRQDLPLMTSPEVRTPLSIGFFRKTLRVVLPERTYSTQELTLIFRHELVHIGREDSGSKFFLVFCTAMCWFNPLMWIAMGRSADDLELSCDETVLLGADEQTRRQYADLLLRTAGDQRGFTTCLSASAKALRYRLKNVMAPHKRLVGGLTAGIIFFALIMSSGSTALAYNEGTGQQRLFPDGELGKYTISSVSYTTDEDFDFYDCTDPAAFTEYLASLSLYQLTGNYDDSEDSHHFTLIYSGPEGGFGVSLREHSVTYTPLHGTNYYSATYYCAGEVDWAYLESLLVPQESEEESALPYPPNMYLYFNEEITPEGELMVASGSIVSASREGDPLEGPFPDTGGVGGVGGFPVEEVTLSFSHELYTGDFTVQVEDWGCTDSYLVSSDQLEEPFVLPLAPYSAHYTVYATVTDGKTVYETEFRFDVEF